MREILFRAKRVGKGTWLYGHYVEQYGSKMIYLPEGVDSEHGFDNYHIDPETLGQFTGLVDKNGNKIFEGDVFVDKGNETIDVVEFRNGKFCLVSYGIKGALMEYGWDENEGGFGECECCAIDDYYVDEMEFTHNIHDNPELLRTPQNDEVRE